MEWIDKNNTDYPNYVALSVSTPSECLKAAAIAYDIKPVPYQLPITKETTNIDGTAKSIVGTRDGYVWSIPPTLSDDPLEPP
eukprot:5059460-Pyramimonas_sp.AAC.2